MLHKQPDTLMNLLKDGEEDKKGKEMHKKTNNRVLHSCVYREVDSGLGTTLKDTEKC